MHNLSALDGQNSRSTIVSPLSILIVDDYEITRSALAHLIAVKMPDAQVRVTADYASSVGLCSLHQVDIVITDLKRASSHMVDIFQRISAANSGIKLILTTGCRDDEELAEVSGMSNARLLEKPVDFAVLIETIQNLVDEMGQSGR
jgi:DNA-binding NtrC family response regulator